MKTTISFCLALCLCALSVVKVRCDQAPPPDVAPSPTAGSPDTQIIERGQDYAVLRHISSSPGPSGKISLSTNQFTLVENGLHYFENGPGGALGRDDPREQ